MRTRADRRKLTYKHIRRHARNSVDSRKGGGLSDKIEAQPHRLYKGRNWDNRGGYAHNTKNLGPSTRDKRAEDRRSYDMDILGGVAEVAVVDEY